MTEPTPSIEEQETAWAAYIAARHRADDTLALIDGAEAVRAWKVFMNLFLADDQKQTIAPRPRNVIVFPVHKTRQSGLLPGGAA